jgi:hypothetical protein
MTTEIIKQFNDILESFIIQITPVVGSSVKTKFDLLVQMNSVLPIEKYLLYALPMRDQILNREESYFNNEENHKDDEVLDLIISIKKVYHMMDKSSQKNIWDIFQALLLLGEEYLRIKFGKK